MTEYAPEPGIQPYAVQVRFPGNFASDAQFFVFTGVMSLLYCLASPLLYTRLAHLYQVLHCSHHLLSQPPAAGQAAAGAGLLPVRLAGDVLAGRLGRLDQWPGRSQEGRMECTLYNIAVYRYVTVLHTAGGRPGQLAARQHPALLPLHPQPPHLHLPQGSPVSAADVTRYPGPRLHHPHPRHLRCCQHLGPAGLPQLFPLELQSVVPV